jgi:hypothetical protein
MYPVWGQMNFNSSFIISPSRIRVKSPGFAATRVPACTNVQKTPERFYRRNRHTVSGGLHCPNPGTHTTGKHLFVGKIGCRVFTPYKAALLLLPNAFVKMRKFFNA